MERSSWSTKPILLVLWSPRIFSEGETHAKRYRVKTLAQAVLISADEGHVAVRTDDNFSSDPIVFPGALSTNLPHALESTEFFAIDNIYLFAGFGRDKQIAIELLIAER